METINVSSESDISVQTRRSIQSNKRRSSIFRRSEVCSTIASEQHYPKEYKDKLQKEEADWNQLFYTTRAKFHKTKKECVQMPRLKLDKTILDKHQLEYLEQEPSAEQYLKAVDDYLNKFQLHTAVQEIHSKFKEIEEENLLHKINIVENMLVEHLKN